MTSKKSNGTYVTDIECFPNMFCATFLDINTEEVHAFVIHESRDESQQLFDFMKTVKTLIGFNSISYDSPMLRCFLDGVDPFGTAEETAAQLFAMSQRLISDASYKDDEIRQLRYPKKSAWKQLDLMKLMAFDKLGISLKQAAINLRQPVIQDLPYPYDAEIAPEQIEIVLDYNANDVTITRALYDYLQPEIKLRREVGKLYDLDITSASRSKIANLILEKRFGEDADIKAIRELRTVRESVAIADCIPDDIHFHAPALKALYAKLQSTVVTRTRGYGYHELLKFAGNEYELGIGGLHSKDCAAILVTDDEFILRDADAASFYPNIILKGGIHPEHLGNKFNRILRDITAERIAAKHAGEKTKADALKITINSIFGKMNSNTFWLEDALAFIRVTIGGQLYLLSLIERLTDAGIEVISANTDGLTSRIPRHLESVYQQVCAEWQTETGFELEFADYLRLVKRDVNNYIAIEDHGTKEKGIFAHVTDLGKGFKMPIIQTCLYQYFVNEQSVESTLSQCQSIYEFCASQKSGAQFVTEFHTKRGIEVLQKNNRFYVSECGGGLVKRHRVTGKTTGLYVGQTVALANRIDPATPFDAYHVDLDFYQREVEDIIHAIVPERQQLAFF